MTKVIKDLAVWNRGHGITSRPNWAYYQGELPLKHSHSTNNVRRNTADELLMPFCHLARDHNWSIAKIRWNLR